MQLSRYSVTAAWLLAVMAATFNAGTALAAEASLPYFRPILGINLASPSYWSSETVFVDLFKQSQPWQAQRKDTGYGRGGPLMLNETGWVRFLDAGQFADSLMCRVKGRYPGGVYTCRYEGRGKIGLGFDARAIHISPGKIRFMVTPSENGMVLRLRKTDPADPVRDIRVLMPGFSGHADRVFHPVFLAQWKPFSVIRFMDWMRTNNSVVVTWADRPVPGMQTQAGPRGVALEYMIELANRLHADPWFCMPHGANDEYIRKFARMVKKALSPDLTVYVEYSNEAWNNRFGQAKYCMRRGLSLGLSHDRFEAGMRYYARRAAQVFEMWETVFGDPARVVCVLGTQFVRPAVSRMILSDPEVAVYADALAVAPYFGQSLGLPANACKTEKMTVAEILDACREDIEAHRRLIEEQRRIAEGHGLALIGYEGGQHLAGVSGIENRPALVHLFKEANRHHRMKALYESYLRGWQNAGGGLMCLFSSTGIYSKWGCWGLLEYTGQPAEAAPKYEAALNFIETN